MLTRSRYVTFDAAKIAQMFDTLRTSYAEDEVLHRHGGAVNTLPSIRYCAGPVNRDISEKVHRFQAYAGIVRRVCPGNHAGHFYRSRPATPTGRSCK